MPTRIATPEETVVVHGFEALHSMRTRFGLDATMLMNGLAAGFESETRRMSRLDVPQTRGNARYNCAAIATRVVAEPQGYAITNVLPRILTSETRNLDVALYFGDDSTGLVDGHPSNAYPKGETMSEIVTLNQGILFPGLLPSFRPGVLRTEIPANSVRPVWVLLVRATRSRLRAEFSSPSGRDSSGFIRAWSERIILPEVALHFEGEPTTDDETTIPAAEIDIPVIPRHAELQSQDGPGTPGEIDIPVLPR